MSAPIVVFVYNRPWHTRETLKSLKANYLSEESELFIYADGPKENATDEQLKKIKEVRSLIRENNWCGKVNIIEREKNMGLASSVISGVTDIVNKFGKVIVLEDDLLLSKNFLKYMNEALDKFENEEKVMQISGYMFPVDLNIEDDAFFLPFTTSWGWATWKRVWDSFDKNGNKIELLEKNTESKHCFDLNGSYPYSKMLEEQQKGKIDSWAIRFYLDVFLKKGIILYPKKTLVTNIGFDGSGVNCKDGIYQASMENIFEIKKYPQSMKIESAIEKSVFGFLGSQNSFSRRIIARLTNFFIK